MNRLYKYIAILSSLLLTCCTANEALDDGEAECAPSPQSCPDSGSELTVIDASGRTLSSLPSEVGNYRLVVNIPERWELCSEDDFIELSKTQGAGPDTVTMIVGNNWWKARNVRIAVKSAKANETASRISKIAEQDASAVLDEVASHISSIRGVGFCYMPNTTYCMGTGMQVFNIPALQDIQEKESVSLLNDDFYPKMEQELFSSDSMDGINDQLAITASADVEYGFLSVNITGYFDKDSQSKEKREYNLLRLKQSYFTREINVYNALALASESQERRKLIYAPGFRAVMDDFVAEVNKAKNALARRQLCEEFVNRVGPAFISKAVLGSTLDFYSSISKSELTTKMAAGGTAKASFYYTFKVQLEGDVNYTESEKKMSEKVYKKFNVRGGDISQVSALTLGNQLDYLQLRSWMLSVTPENAVLIDMKLTPIYAAVTDPVAHEALMEYFNEKTKNEK